MLFRSKILQGVKETGQLEGWVSEKITLANDYLRTVYEYLSYENIEQESLPTLAMESMEARYRALLEDEQLDELSWNDVKKGVAGAALAGTMALGGMGAAHADEAPRDVPAATAQADAPVPLSKRFTPGVEFPAAYTIAYNGKEYKFAGRGEEAPKAGEVITVPMAMVGIRGLGATKVKVSPDGQYYVVPRDVNESATGGASVAGGFATGPVADAAPIQRRVKKESIRYANAMKTKQPKLGKGVY